MNYAGNALPSTLFSVNIGSFYNFQSSHTSSNNLYFTVPQEHKFFEDAFKVYERGVQVFKYPHVRLIWSMYLDKFVGRYGGKKLERARDLFEQALKEVRTIVFSHVYQFQMFP
jgi:hypothetical protein